jgi:hypothetical protein
MIIEALIFRQSVIGNVEGTTLSDIDFAACSLIIVFFIVIYLLLLGVALYTILRCTSIDSPFWMLFNIFIAFMFPSLYLLIHPNLVLSHSGPKSYCQTY